MLKKLVSLLLLAALLFSLCACAAQGGQETGGSYDDLMGELQSSNSPEPEEPKRTLRFWFLGGTDVSTAMYNHATAYMALHPDVLIELEPQGYDYDREELSVQLMSGQAADVLETYGNAKELTSGHFLDLYPFMEQDPNFREEDYFMDILTGAETDGKLYGLGTWFSIYGLYAMRKDLDPEAAEWFETAETVTYADMIRLYQEVGQAEGLVIYNTFLPTDAFDYYCDSLIDLENKTCNYQNEELKAVLEQALTLPADPRVSYSAEDGVSAEGMPHSATSIDISEYRNTEYPYFFYQPRFPRRADFLFPYEGTVFTRPRVVTTASGKGLYLGGTTLSITDSCEDPELAWDFIKFCIANKEEPYEALAMFESGYSSTLGPYPSVNRFNYAKQCELNVTTQYDSIAEVTGETPAGDREQVIADALDFLTSLPDYFQVNYSDYDQVGVWPEEYLWLSGQRDLDTTLENIQSKMTLYLNE